MTATPTEGQGFLPERVHLLEFGGQGGVFHHTVAVGRALSAGGIDVVLHTAADAEDLGDGLTRCGCLDWARRLPRPARQVVTAKRFVANVVPHLCRSFENGDLFHVQGLFAHDLSLLMMRRLQRSGATVILSPHNTFARSGTARSRRTLNALIRRADGVIVFTQHDQDVVRQLGVDAVRADLDHFLPAPSEADLEHWRSVYGDGPVALLSGQVRADKRPDAFIEACRQAGVTAAIVGPPNDGEYLVDRARGEGGVVRIAKYVDSDEFTATLVAADVVVATHVIGSGSGPLAIARDLGLRTVAADVGGLSEFASTIARGSSADDYANAITEALAGPQPAQHHSTALLDQHLAAYRQFGVG